MFSVVVVQRVDDQLDLPLSFKADSQDHDLDRRPRRLYTAGYPDAAEFMPVCS